MRKSTMRSISTAQGAGVFRRYPKKMATDPPTWRVIEKFEADHPELASSSEFFFRTNFFNSFMDVLGGLHRLAG